MTFTVTWERPRSGPKRDAVPVLPVLFQALHMLTKKQIRCAGVYQRFYACKHTHLPVDIIIIYAGVPSQWHRQRQESIVETARNNLSGDDNVVLSAVNGTLL